jgi:2-C-methyl-D-erythritol 2,4-cyclodiphosphate synthase
LGALGLPDIGHYFPPGEASCKDISSLLILEKCATLCEENGYRLMNVDSSLVAEAPKVLPHAPAMKENIAKALGITAAEVGIKATTNETMGFVGRREGMAAFATALVVKEDWLENGAA